MHGIWKWFTLAGGAVVLCSTLGVAQSDKGDSWTDALVQWHTKCAARGCIMETDVLRGISGEPTPPDPHDAREYIGVDVAIERNTRKPAYMSFIVDPRAQKDQGVFITFSKTEAIDGKWTMQLDPKGPIRVPITDCYEDYCAARVPQGITKDGPDSRQLDLLQAFLHSDALLVLYMREGKAYRTMVVLSSFKKEYSRVMATELKPNADSNP